MNLVKEKRGISGYTIKMLAIVTMLIDHIGYMLAYLFYYNKDMQIWVKILRTVGRIAFPLFCFLLVEGFIHTKNIKKYAIRLFIFSLISEIPYDLALYRELTFDAQNVFFTLLIGLLVLAAMKKFSDNYLIQAIMVGLGCGLSILLKTDYNWEGIIIIVILYYFRNNILMKTIVGGVMMFYSSLGFGYGMAVLSLIPIRLYNGTKGKNYMKYLFYWFYPVHLLILYGITEYFRILIYVK